MSLFTFAEENYRNSNLITGDGKYRVYNSLNQLSKIYNGYFSKHFYIIQK